MKRIKFPTLQDIAPNVQAVQAGLRACSMSAEELARNLAAARDRASLSSEELARSLQNIAKMMALGDRRAALPDKPSPTARPSGDDA